MDREDPKNSVHVTGQAATSQSSTSLVSFLLVMLAGPLIVLLIAAVIVMFDPDMMLGDDEGNLATAAPYGSGTGFPGQQPAQPPQPYTTR
ncbi:hypothetical protein [Streptomyces sp. NBC_01483]|uniref:hypothetical protein n=1 Tax=Streptomyces sp. NBC_01483 TaxID=2903883 RepID=UPI002E353421|nr:hypothetical protein [Streptomyces sp. NBC_01483]